jgi:hypothetical protein
MTFALKCIPKQTGTLVLGASVYHTHSQGRSCAQLPLTRDGVTQSAAISCKDFESKWGHTDESFLYKDFKYTDRFFGIVRARPWKYSWETWPYLETMKVVEVRREIDVMQPKTLGQRARETVQKGLDLFASLF